MNLEFRILNLGSWILYLELGTPDIYLGPKIWNNLHSDLKSAENANGFKHDIKNYFFKDLQNQEDNP